MLGFDGMDPKFVERHADRLPNLMRLAKQGSHQPLETVMPPQSPVAWSTVITGLTPGGHGIFDFVHRDPVDRSPFSSMAKTIPPRWTLKIGAYSIPLAGGETIPLRKGEPFWTLLEDRGIPTSILKMPTDFPTQPASNGAISGMGTPDMLGTFGTFQFYTDNPEKWFPPRVSGGEIYRVKVQDDRIQTVFRGPENSLLTTSPRIEVPLEVEIDRDNNTALVQLGATKTVLERGQWSDWVTVDFELVPNLKSASGIVRMYLRQLEPHFELYLSPINIDPSAPEAAISSPSDFAAHIVDEVGPFYTQGMAEETKGLSAHVIDRDEFVQQAHIVFDEEIAMYEHVLGDFVSDPGGMMFYYFSTTDQAAHMLWGDYEEKLLPFYEQADAVVGHTLDRIDDDTLLLVISDHGFQRFDRQVHLNTWLAQERFLVRKDGGSANFEGVDWSQSQVYAMGLNGLYFNKEGREVGGIVKDDEIPKIRERLERRLLALRDPENGNPIVERLYEPQAIFEGDAMEFAPDLLVGFYPPYRMSPEAGLGELPDIVVEDNPDEWIGDHCMAHDHVPGVLFSNKVVTKPNPSLHDIPVTILSAFGVEVPPTMVGGDLFEAQ